VRLTPLLRLSTIQSITAFFKPFNSHTVLNIFIQTLGLDNNNHIHHIHKAPIAHAQANHAAPQTKVEKAGVKYFQVVLCNVFSAVSITFAIFKCCSSSFESFHINAAVFFNSSGYLNKLVVNFHILKSLLGSNFSINLICS